MSLADGAWASPYHGVPTTNISPVRTPEGGYATPPEEETMTQHLPGSDTQNGLFIPGVVDQVERSKLLEFITGLGLDYEHLREISIYNNEIVVEIFALKDGQRYFVPDPMDDSPNGGHVAVHRISIPVRP